VSDQSRSELLPDIALSVRQPWAWAIMEGGKPVENRSAAAVRHGMKPGRICIHAAKGMTREEYEAARDFMASIGVMCPHPSQLVFGAIIGTVTVTEIVKEHPSPWFFGPCALVLADPQPILPIDCTGALGYFNWRSMLARERKLEVPKWLAKWKPSPRDEHPSEQDYIDIPEHVRDPQRTLF
jgi:hypothetical protein